MDDYSSFSMKAIEADLKKMRQEAVNKAIAAGLTPEFAIQAADLAFERVAMNFMEVNCFTEPKEQL